MSGAGWAQIRAAASLFEDEAVLALNKPPGVSVMGERHATDLVRLAEEAGERLFPVHRIDKVTSGVVLFAKELRHHGVLTRQFNRQTVDKAYLAVVRSAPRPPEGDTDGGPPPRRGTIELPLSVGRKSRVRVAGPREAIVHRGDVWSLPRDAVFKDKRTYPSRTEFARVWHGAGHALLAVRPVTGRRHQIRVHLAWIGHPIEGDPLFDRGNADGHGDGAAGACLHSWRLSFDAAWAGGERRRLVAPPPDTFWRALRSPAGGRPDQLLERAGTAAAQLADA